MLKRGYKDEKRIIPSPWKAKSHNFIDRGDVASHVIADDLWCSYHFFYCCQFQLIMPSAWGMVYLGRCQGLEKNHHGAFICTLHFMWVNSLHLLEVYSIRLGLLLVLVQIRFSIFGSLCSFWYVLEDFNTFSLTLPLFSY